MPYFTERIKITGSWVTESHYNLPRQYDYSKTDPILSIFEPDPEQQELELYKPEKRQIIERTNFGRARTAIKDYIKCNLPMDYNPDTSNKFVTFTFAENLTDFNRATYEYAKFIKRLRYSSFYNGKQVTYLTVPERQQRGAWHYHTIMFNAPFMPFQILQPIWRNGDVNIKMVRDPDHMGNYISKYITKDFTNGLYYRKSYFTSKNLIKPTIIRDREKIEYLRPFLKGIEPVNVYIPPEDDKYSAETYSYDLTEYPDILSTFRLETDVKSDIITT